MAELIKEGAENAGAALAAESLIVSEAPDGAPADECRAFGKAIAANQND
jgi:hypothetical protein